MSSRRVQTWVWWLLPLLVARALMPVGFMAQAVDGKLQIALCSAGFAQPDTAQSGTDIKDVDGKHASAQTDFSCPFAHAAAAPLLDISNSAAIPFLATAEILPPAESPYYASGPPRLDRARGPPARS